MLKKLILTFLLITISTFQLNFFGWLPRETKIIGDVLFIFLVFYLLFSDKNSYKNDNTISDLAIIPKRLVIVFIIYILFQILYSFFLWGEIQLILQQSRRWLIASIYFFIIISLYPIFFSNKLIFKYLIFTSFLITINIFLLNSGFDFPSADSVWQAQGDILVFKPFIPGTIILYFFFIHFAILFFTKELTFTKKVLSIILILFFAIICMELIPFRGWVITSFLGIGTSLTIFYISKNKFSKLLKPIVTIFFALVLILATNFASDKIKWLSSSFIDVNEIKGDFLTRYITDISKLEILETRDIFLLGGIGFVHQSSNVADMIGFSSETNDTGWVEILLTGGITGSILFLILYISFLRFFIKLYLISNNRNILTLVSIWIMSGLLLFSSNVLLWDFGFVPISLFSIAILSKYYSYENDNVGG